MTFNPADEGFLWPDESHVTNAYDESMTIRPSATRAGFETETDESRRMSLRMYSTSQGDMTENQVIQWICGGAVAWTDILKSIHGIVGDQRPMNVSTVRQQMLQQGVSELAFDLTLLRLSRGGYARIDGEGEGRMITIIRW